MNLGTNETKESRSVSTLADYHCIQWCLNCSKFLFEFLHLLTLGNPLGIIRKCPFPSDRPQKNNKLNLEMVCSIFKLVRAYYGKLRQMRKMMDGKKVGQRLMAVLVVQAWLLSSALLLCCLLLLCCHPSVTCFRQPPGFQRLSPCWNVTRKGRTLEWNSL